MTYLDFPHPAGSSSPLRAPRVVRQTALVAGRAYELQEVYGLEAASGAAGTEDQATCVVCLSEPRTTTVYPCRHFVLCASCAGVLRGRGGTPQCPVCRCTITKLLSLNVANDD